MPASRPDIFEKIRIKPKGSKKREEIERAANECAWQECTEPGTHKAPMGRNHQGHYLYFCLEHVRLYNKNFNYFSGLNEEQIAQFQRESRTGNRPTWKMSNRKKGEKVDLSSLRGTPAWHKRVKPRYAANGQRIVSEQSATFERKLKPMEVKAFNELGLKSDADKDQITAQYKLLVKENHPDSNGGDRSCEARLQRILAAYKTLKKAGLC